jgi:hypothetical protein
MTVQQKSDEAAERLKSDHALDKIVGHALKDQVDTLVQKGYGPNDEVDKLIEEHRIVENVPNK